MPGDRLILLDIDGVIADDRHRVHYALAKEWYDYFARIEDDSVWPQGFELYAAGVAAGWEVGYLTGRREDLRDGTRRWLAEHGFDSDLKLYMRPVDDRRPLAELKAHFLQREVLLWEEVRLYDDDPEVIRLAGEHGRHCTWYRKDPRMVKKARA